MTVVFAICLTGGLLALAAGCGSKPAAPPQFVYEQEAIEVHIKADPQLNLYDGLPHTLLLCVYQLREPNAFNQLSDQPGGIYTLLECAPFDPSVTAAKRLIVHPDQDVKYLLDRAEGTRFLSIVAGYYGLQKGNILRFYDIPVIEERQGLTGKVAKPGHLTIELNLGPQRIEDQAETGAPAKAN